MPADLRIEDDSGATTNGVVDCGILHSWKSPLDVFEYLPQGWREYALTHIAPSWREYALGRGEKPAGAPQTPLSLDHAYNNPFGDFVPGSVPAGAVAGGSDLDLMREQHLDPNGIQLALLTHGLGAIIPGHGVVKLSVELVRAINNWTIDRWLGLDDRLLGTILAPTQVPELAAAEIRRVGAHDRMAAVLLTVSGLGRPFGHPSYDPIFEAAHELELPIVIQSGGDQTMETATYPTAAGVPGTYTEFRALGGQALMSHAGSIIGQGVMHRYPSLRFMLLSGGVAWVTPWLWKFDENFRAFRHDMLFMKGTPSEAFRDYFFVGTFPFQHKAAGDSLGRYLKADPEHQLGDVICYSSGYPDRESVGPETVASALPEEWRSKVLSENPLRFLGARGEAALRASAGAAAAQGGA